MTVEKSKTMSFRVSDEEMRQIEEAVSTLGYENNSDLCRSLIFSALAAGQLSPQLQDILGAVQSLSASVKNLYIANDPKHEKEIAALFDQHELQARALASRFLIRQPGRKKGTK